MLYKDVLSSLCGKGYTFSQIGKMFPRKNGKPISREWIRKLAHRYGIKRTCKCGNKLHSQRSKLCDVCNKRHRIEKSREYRIRSRCDRDVYKRDVVLRLSELLTNNNVGFIPNTSSKNGEYELNVAGLHVKCLSIVKKISGYQVRIDVDTDVDLFFLACDETMFLLPAKEVKRRINYIGKRSDLMWYSSQIWFDVLLEALREQ